MTGAFQASDCNTLAITLRCSSTAPLLTPVVPPVYCNTATSSGPSVGRLSVALVPRAMASLKRTACGSLNAGTSFFTWRTT